MEETLDQTDSIRAEAQKNSQAVPPTTPPQAPVVPGYRLEELIGNGSFGQVWAGRQTRTGLEVAVKIFTRPAGLDWDYLRQEVSRLGRVAEHPHVVSLLDAGLEQTPPYFVMRRYGRSLSAWRQEHPRPPLQPILDWWEQIAQALAYTHSKGLLHCDLKPSNVLLDAENRAILCDFGQSVARGGGGTHFGSLGYMAPEQAGQLEEGFGTPDIRWDVYALGATLYFLFTGCVPRLSKDTLGEIGSLAGTAEKLSRYRMELAQRPLEPVRRHCPALHPELAHLLEACLALNPARRPQNATEILEDLRRFRQGQPLLSRRPWSAGYRLNRFVRRNAVAVTLTSAIAALSTFGLVNHWNEQNRLQAQADFDRGMRELQEGRAGSAAHWWLRSLQVQPGDSAARWQLAHNAGTSLEFYADLKQPLNEVGFSADGNLLYASSESGTQVFDLRTGSPRGGVLGGPGPRPNRESRPVYQNNPPASLLLPQGRLLTLAEKTQLWDLSSGEEIPVQYPPSTVACASADGSRVLLRSPQGMWLAAGPLQPVKTRTEPRKSALSADGRVIAYGDSDGGIWVQTEGEARRVGQLEGPVELLALSPDGAEVAGSSETPGATLWDLHTGHSRHFGTRNWGLFGLAFRPDGKQLAGSSYDGQTYLWNLQDEKAALIQLRHRWLTYGSTYSPDGRMLATFSLDGSARIWDSDTGRPLSGYLEHSSPVKAVAFRPGPGILGALDVATACEDGTVRLFRVDQNDRPVSLGPSCKGYQGSYNPAGTRLAAACESADGKRGWVQVYDTSAAGHAPRPLARMDLSAGCRSLAWCNDDELVSGCQDGSVTWLRLSGSERRALPSLPGPVNDLDVSPDGQLLGAVGDDGTGLLYDLSGQRTIARLDPAGEAPMWAVHFSPDSSQLVSTSDHQADLWDRSGRHLREFRHANDVREAAFSPDGRWLATGSLDKTARIWDVGSGKPLSPSLPHELAVVHVQFSPDGQILSTASADGMARLWSTGTGQAALGALRHRGPVWNAVFSPDGTMLATCSKTGECRVWGQSGQQLIAPIEHDDFTYSVCFRPDGRALATISWDGTVQQRDLTPPPKVSLAQLQRQAGKRTGLKLVTELGRCLIKPLTVQEWKEL